MIVEGCTVDRDADIFSLKVYCTISINITVLTTDVKSIWSYRPFRLITYNKSNEHFKGKYIYTHKKQMWLRMGNENQRHTTKAPDRLKTGSTLSCTIACVTNHCQTHLPNRILFITWFQTRYLPNRMMLYLD